MNRQEYYRREYKKINPQWQDSLSLYKDLIAENVHGGSFILDVGCGHGDFLKDVYARTPNTFGVDPDPRALEKNTIIQNKFTGTAAELLFKDNYFDLVVLAWVLEHLEKPQKVFKEICRVLKPGGKVIFLTPNKLNYNVWIIRLIPEKFHEFFTTRLYRRQEHDTYPQKYRINSPRRIRKILSAAGFQQKNLILNGDPSYISFNNFLFKTACLGEKIIAKIFPSAKVHLVGVFRKPENSA